MPPVVRRLAGWLLVLLFAGVGAWAGTRWKAVQPPVEVPVPPTPGLPVGSGFPDEPVLDEASRPFSLLAPMRGQGGVVLFLDPECPPCQAMAAAWQKRLDDGLLDGRPLLGVIEGQPAQAAAFRASHGVTFPVFADTAWAFLKRHHVEDYPFCVYVDGAGVVRRATFSPETPVTRDSLDVLSGS